jgi:hypothetical protein
MTQISIQITIGSSPELLDRYVVAWSFSNQSKQYVFAASGGVIQETLLLEDGATIPDSISVNIAVDFTPQSKIPGYSFSKQVSRDSNVFSYFFEIGQMVRAVTLGFDLPWDWVGRYVDDYLFIKWTYSEISKPLYTGLFVIRSEEFTSFVTKSFYFLQDPGGTGISGDISYEITGRLHKWAVEKFQKSFSILDGEFIVLRPEFRDSPSRFLLKVVS